MFGSVAAFMLGGCSNAVDSTDEDIAGNMPPTTVEQGLRGGSPHVHPTKDAAPLAATPPPGLMSSHGGTILTTNVTHAVFWGKDWTSSSFAGDKITGMDSFFSGFGGSGLARASTEYTGSNGKVTATSTYAGHQIDSSPAPATALQVSAAVAEVCKVTSNRPDANGIYFLFTSTGTGPGVGFCAWHSWGNCSNGAPLQVAYMPNVDGVSGCNPQDTFGTGHSEGLAALANVTSHELSEAITDPRGGGWFDSSGQENGDKCAWSFHGAVTLSNGSKWKLQMEWSNAAFSNNTGFANGSGQKGCLQGN